MISFDTTALEANGVEIYLDVSKDVVTFEFPDGINVTITKTLLRDLPGNSLEIALEYLRRR